MKVPIPLAQLSVDGVHFEHQVRLPVIYEGVQLDAGYRIDFLVENCVIIERKAVEKLLPLHTAQMMTYLRLSAKSVGLLINFNVAHLRQGLRRVVNGSPPGDVNDDGTSMSSVSSVVESLPGTGDRQGEDDVLP